jgi:uncharacterized protein YdhG (YjbR/CyaY superfamily)
MAEARKRTEKKNDGFTPEERAAMKERARELKADAAKANGAEEVLAKIAEMAAPDRALAERVHSIVTSAAPHLVPRLWYGMPAYAHDGKVVCFFQDAQKFKSRYSTLGFQDPANLDDGTMWATSFAITALTAADEERITKLVKKAVS